NTRYRLFPYTTLFRSTGEMTPWFIQDTSFDNLLFLRREEPWFDSERIQAKVDYRMFGYTRYDCGYCDWRGLVGSKGTREQIVIRSEEHTSELQSRFDL